MHYTRGYACGQVFWLCLCVVWTGDNGRGRSCGEAISGGDRLAVKAMQDGRGRVLNRLPATRQSARQVNVMIDR